MKVTPRSGEVKEIVKLLEGSEYDSAEALAKDIIKKVAELFAERDWHAYAWRMDGGLVLAWGPLSSDTEVQKFATKAALGGEHISVKLYSTASMLDRIEEGDKGVNRHCTSCRHPIGAHEHPKAAGMCKVQGCPCKTATK